ncbi:aldose epimerase family protein [Sphingomonas sp.]|uniref:aldose epimerase family protein n=1 Tax=Sphingomonas sp. TaxID=28214 RepID=UPI003AFF9EE4
MTSTGLRTPTATLATFGRLPDGREVPTILLTNAHGLSVRLIAYGAAVQSIMLPDRAGRMADVVLGYATVGEYLAKPQYFGATVGRFANRIARGRFTIDGQEYRTPVNDGGNALHGGAVGFDKVLWAVAELRSDPAASVTMRYISRDGDQGYPGTMAVDAIYRLDDENRLSIEYRASTDRSTIVNITNHTYWNLAGEGSPAGAMGHLVTIPGESFLPTDAGAIPTGEFRPVQGTPFDFRTPRVISERVRDAGDQQLVFGRGYDHNWVIRREVTPDLHLMARLHDPSTGRGFELASNQPGLQFYSGNFLDGSSHGKTDRIYRGGDAIVLEPQIFPDTPNQPAFGSAVLHAAETYRNIIVYQFTVDGSLRSGG